MSTPNWNMTAIEQSPAQTGFQPGPVQVMTTNLSSFEILHLIATPKLAVPAPPSGFAIYPMAATWSLHYLGVAYTNLGTDNLALNYGASGSWTGGAISLPAAGFLDNVVDAVYPQFPPIFFQGSTTPRATVEALPLHIRNDNAGSTGEWLAGTSTLTVAIYYMIVPF